MELTLDRDDFFISNMYKLLSIPNKNLIRWLLLHNYVSCAEMHISLMKLFCHLYHIPIQCSSFSCVLNSLLTSYLKSVVNKSSKYCALKHIQAHHASTNYNLTEIFLHNIGKKSLFQTAGIEIPVQIIHTKSDNVEITQDNEKFVDRSGNVSTDNDFHSFLLPLEQDYTKSSIGYNSHVIHKVKDKNTYSVLNESKYLQIDDVVNYNKISTSIPEGYEVVYKQVQKDISFKNTNTLKGTDNESKPSYKVLDSDIISYLQDFNSCAQRISPERVCFTNEYNEITFNHSLKVFPDYRNQQLNCDTKSKFYTPNSDSVSNDSVIFSENSKLKEEKCDINIVLQNSVNSCCDSDSGDGIVFSENVDDGQESEFGDKNYDNLNLWDDDFDENDPDLFETFNLSFDEDDFSALSCSQNKMHDKPFSTYEYVNACFEDDDDLFAFSPIVSINKNWNNTMKDVSSEPRTPKKVSFVALPDLVSVETFEPDNDGYRYSQSVLDQIRFQNRIQEFAAVMGPYLTSEHRAKVYSQIICVKSIFS